MGPVAVALEVLSPERFDNAEQVASYLGLTSTVRQSREKRGKGRLYIALWAEVFTQFAHRGSLGLRACVQTFYAKQSIALICIVSKGFSEKFLFLAA